MERRTECMKYLFALLMTVAVLAVSAIVYAFLCWIIENRPTFSGFTLVLVVNLMFQFYCETFKGKDKEDRI